MSAAVVTSRQVRVKFEPAPAVAAPAAAKLAPKPVALQINTSGAWRLVVKFDASDADACGVIEHHGPALAVVGRGSLRIVVDDGTQDVLRHWDLEHGWRDWGRT